MSANNPRIQNALTAWRNAIGGDQVIVSGPVLEKANRGTFETDVATDAVLRPKDRDEVVACIHVAREQNVPLYPISGGRNWGYGSGQPSVDGIVTLSLDRLNNITGFDADLGCVTIEPGVSFGALDDFVRAQGGDYLPPQTGASPAASVTGNTLERGIGKGLYEDMIGHVRSFDVVLPGGSIMSTGFTKDGMEGFGPLRNGLFAQSNLGVVVAMTLWLEPAPKLRRQILFPLIDDQALIDFINSSRRMLQQNAHTVQMEVLNDYRLIAGLKQFPFHEADPLATLPRKKLHVRFRGFDPNSRWLAAATIWGDTLEELDWKEQNVCQSVSRFRSFSSDEETALFVSKASENLQPAYWRNRNVMPENPDPDDDRCGIIWFAPMWELRGELTHDLLSSAQKILVDHGMDPLFSLRLAGGRVVRALIALTYDRDQLGTPEKTINAHSAISDFFQQRGIPSYRLSLLDFPKQKFDPTTAAFLGAIKAAVDHDGIVAPGRYLPSATSRDDL
jgi:4-cresol dehydrogenase (hydroxylating)